MIAVIEDHRDTHGVEPISDTLPITPALRHEHLAKRVDPSRLSDRAIRDAELRPHIRRVLDANRHVQSLCKVWLQLHRRGFEARGAASGP